MITSKASVMAGCLALGVFSMSNAAQADGNPPPTSSAFQVVPAPTAGEPSNRGTAVWVVETATKTIWFCHATVDNNPVIECVTRKLP